MHIKKLLVLNEALFGPKSNEKFRLTMRKIPNKFFYDFREIGALRSILISLVAFMNENSLKDIDPKNTSILISLFQRIQTNLENDGFLKIKIFKFANKFSEKDLKDLKDTVVKMGAKLTDSEDSFTHFVSINTPKYDSSHLLTFSPGNYYTVVDEKNNYGLVHFVFSPGSHDKWMNVLQVNGERIQTTQKDRWIVSPKYILDSDKFNEWMEEYDYDIDTSFENRKRKQDDFLSPSKKTKFSDLSFEDSEFKHPIIIPSYSIWFKMGEINDIEKRGLSEFFDKKSNSRTPEIYKQYRDFMIKAFRSEPNKYLSVSNCRKSMAGDINCIMRVHSFLEHWGLINYGVAPGKPTPEDSNDNEVIHDPSKITLEKLVTLAPILPVVQKEQVPIVMKDNDWTQEEVTRLLKGIETHQEDWTKVAAVVGTRSREDCLSYFLRLPIEDEFLSTGVRSDQKTDDPLPFSDSTNPIMQTVAFLTSMVHPSIAAAAAQACLTELEGLQTQAGGLDVKKLDNKSLSHIAIGASAARAKVLAQKEERDIQRLIALILEKQLRKLEIKLKSLDQLEKLMQTERASVEESKKKLQEEKLALRKKE